MKKITIFFFLSFYCSFAAAQNNKEVIKSVAKNIDNIHTVLDILGVWVFKYDISALPGNGNISVYVDEKIQGSPQRVYTSLLGSKKELNDLSIYIIPETDSTVRFHFDVPNTLRRGSPFLKLQPVLIGDNNKRTFTYNPKEYLLPYVKETDRTIPLVLYGSSWLTSESGLRFCFGPECGAEVDDLNINTDEKVLDIIPHYYILGIEIE